MEPAQGGDEKWQPDVYRLATLIGKSVQARNVLDVGCGDGKKTVGLLNHFPEVQCFGHAPRRREAAAAASPGHRVRPREPDDLPYGFDMVVASDVIEHLPNPDKLLHKILHSGCKIAIVSTPERVAMSGSTTTVRRGTLATCASGTLLEFRAFLMASGFGDPLMFTTRSWAEAEQWATTVAVLRP